MRFLLLTILSIGLAACNSAQSAKTVANEEYAIGSYEQSLKAYQLCVEQNPGDQQKCSALARVMEADKKRYDRDATGF